MITQQEVRLKTPERFWSKIKFGEPDQCWEWMSAIAQTYGAFEITVEKNKYKLVKPHRFLYELLFGSIGSTKILVCHTCDNRICCNPNHLWLGTHKDNVHDCMEKGRRAVPLLGEQKVEAILSYQDVVQIKTMMFEDNMGDTDISRVFGVSRSCIKNIRRGTHWKHVQYN